jgi:hypothetical protein
MKSRTDKRLDDIERKLTPRQWALRLAAEIRRYPSGLELNKSIAKGTYRESPFMKPLFALEAQAEDRHPGWRLEDVRARQQLSRKLQMQFRAFANLIYIAQDEAEEKSERGRERAAALATQLQHLIVRDVLAHPGGATAAEVELCKTLGAEETECRSDVGVKEAGQVAIAHSRRTSFLLARDWADDAASYLMELFICEAAIEEVQKIHFNAHSIVAPDIEKKLKSSIDSILEAVVIFNEYVNEQITMFTELERPVTARCESPDKACWTREIRRWSSLTLEVEGIKRRADDFARLSHVPQRWAETAKFKAREILLRGTRKYKGFIWESFCGAFGTKKDKSSAG